MRSHLDDEVRLLPVRVAHTTSLAVDRELLRQPRVGSGNLLVKSFRQVAQPWRPVEVRTDLPPSDPVRPDVSDESASPDAAVPEV